MVLQLHLTVTGQIGKLGSSKGTLLPESFHYLYIVSCLLYEAVTFLLFRELVFVWIHNAKNYFCFGRNPFSEFVFLASQRFTHPCISFHTTLSVGRIDM